MIINLGNFTGEYPRTNPYQLPENAAQRAVDCNFIAGSLKGLSGDSVSGEFGAGVKSIYVHNGINKFSWSRDVDAVKSPVVNDKYDRFYWSDDTGFYVSNGSLGGGGEPSTSNRYFVGVPPPVAAPVIEVAKFLLPGMYVADDAFGSFAGVDGMLYDERVDGTLDATTKVPVLADWTVSPTGATTTFTARAPKSTANVTTTSTTSSSDSSGNSSVPTANSGWTLNSDSNWTPYHIGSSSGPTATMYVNGNGYQAFHFNDGTGSNPSSVTCYQVFDNGGDSGTTSTQFSTWIRMGSTYWYTNGPSTATPPSTDGPTSGGSSSSESSSTSSIDSPYAGPMVELNIKMGDGSTFVKAQIRSKSTDSTWPAEMQGVTGTLSYSGPAEGNGTYTISLSASSSVIETRAYTYTYVNQWQEEGPPAPPSIVECAETAQVKLTFSQPMSGFCPVYKVRLYRTSTGSATNYLYVGEFLVTQTEIIDDVKNGALGATLDTQNYYPPYVVKTDNDGNITGVNTSQTIKGIKTMANGIVCGFRGNEVWFSEPYLPYAWSPAAIKPLPHRVVGICPFEGGLYVTTTAEPYIVMGAAPEYMTDAKVSAIQAGVSKNSIVNFGAGVIYASHDGLVIARGTDSSLNLSHKFFTRDEWQSRYGSRLTKIGIAVHDGSILGYFTDGTPGFLIRFEEEAESFVNLTAPYIAAYKYDLADALLVSTGSAVNYFRGTLTTSIPFVWHSKDFIFQKPISMAAVQLVGTGTVSFDVYADGVVKHGVSNITLNPYDRNVFRLPSGFLCRRWSVKFTGTQNAELREAYISTSMQELQDV